MTGAISSAHHGLLSARAPARDQPSEGHAFAAFVGALYEHDVRRTAESWVLRQRAFHRWRDVFLEDAGGQS